MTQPTDAHARAAKTEGCTRREVLIRAAGTLTAAAMSSRMASAAGRAAQVSLLSQTMADFPVGEIMTRLSTYMSEAPERALPEEVMERAKRHVLDTFAAIVSGSELEPGRAALKFARAYGGKPVATIIGDTTLCGPIEAALVNGTMGHADETDDTLAPGPWHPGCNVVPAAFALGEQFKASGVHFLRAVVLGYDVGTRVLAAIQSGIPNSHKLSYGIGAVFGSAAAGGAIAKFSPEQMRWTLSYAAQQSSGIESFPRDPDHIEKGFIFGGMGARSGVTAVLLVHAGWNAVHDIMSGPDNFIAANAPKGEADRLTDGLGMRYEITRANIKRWTVGQPIHAPLDAVEALLAKQRIDPEMIKEVAVRYQPGSITDNSGPSDINVQHALSVMLIDKTLTFRSIHDKARMKDPAVVRLKAKVRLVPGAAGGRGAAGAPSVPLIQITMTDGTQLTQDTVGPVLGTAANPMSREQLIAKSRDLMLPVLGETQTTRLIDAVMSLEKSSNVGDLRRLLQRGNRNGSPRLSEYPFVK